MACRRLTRGPMRWRVAKVTASSSEPARASLARTRQGPKGGAGSRRPADISAGRLRALPLAATALASVRYVDIWIEAGARLLEGVAQGARHRDVVVEPARRRRRFQPLLVEDLDLLARV